jgi:hypothetical protein
VFKPTSDNGKIPNFSIVGQGGHTTTKIERFAECLGEQYIGNGFFAEYFLSGTRQSLCQVSLGTRQRKVVVTMPDDRDDTFVECSR